MTDTSHGGVANTVWTEQRMIVDELRAWAEELEDVRLHVDHRDWEACARDTLIAQGLRMAARMVENRQRPGQTVTNVTLDERGGTA